MEGALRHFDGTRLRLIAWVIMPNHVHVCFTINAAWRLEQVLAAWKRHTAREINQLTGATGSLWQRDYFDRLVRDARHLGRVLRYIRSNPERACLREGEYTHWESDWARDWTAD